MLIFKDWLLALFKLWAYSGVEGDAEGWLVKRTSERSDTFNGTIGADSENDTAIFWGFPLIFFLDFSTSMTETRRLCCYCT